MKKERDYSNLSTRGCEKLFAAIVLLAIRDYWMIDPKGTNSELHYSAKEFLFKRGRGFEALCAKSGIDVEADYIREVIKNKKKRNKFLSIFGNYT